MTADGVPADRTIVTASIHWDVPPPEGLASRVRELLSCIYKDVLEPDDTNSVAMAAHELLENLVKYSVQGTSSFEIEIRERHGQAFVRLQTRNMASPEHARGAKQLVERLSSSPDPSSVYVDLISTSPFREGSGLGIARVCAEGCMDITCSSEGSVVTLVAQRRVAVRRGAS
jgi:hypothetical protein